MTDPVSVITEIIGEVEPHLDSAVIAAAVQEVTRSRTARRRLARALVEKPSLLTCGRTEGPPLVDTLVRILLEHGAVEVVAPCCPGCGKPAKQMSTRDENGLRRCVTCDNNARGIFTARPCASCGRVLRPQAYDRQGRPRCGQCPPDPGVDHVEVIVDAIVVVSPAADPVLLRGLVTSTVRQAARRRQVAWDLQDRPDLLTGAAASGSPIIRRLVAMLAAHKVDGVVVPQCPLCGMTRELNCRSQGQACCNSCYQNARATRCTHCGQVQPIAARDHDGKPLCWSCTRQAEFNKGVCSDCGRFTAIITRRGGTPLCSDCREIPMAWCSVCGDYKPCYGADTATPRCPNCCQRVRTAQCARCSRTRRIGGRDAAGNPLCGNCACRREPCCRCGRVRQVSGQIADGALCWTCIKTEPAYWNPCLDCGTLAWRRHGLCTDCRAPKLLDAALAGPEGGVREDLLPVRHALAASNPATLVEWVVRRRGSAMLSRLAAADGPITHDTFDGLEPAGSARFLRQLLMAHGVLPSRDLQLHNLTRWFDIKLAEVEDPEARRLLRGYLTWTHLARLRRSATFTTPYAAASIRGEVKSAIKLLAWLGSRGRDWRECTQADLDEWCMRGGRAPYRARSFVAWCADRGHLGDLAIATPRQSDRREILNHDEQRWELTRRLLHDKTLTTIDRVAGLLVLLYGQSATRIVALTTDDVLRAEDQVKLRLGRHPLHIPSPLDGMLLELVATRRGKASLGHTDNHQWLFPGGWPGAALHPDALAKRLRDLDIPVRAGRNTALMENAATMPAKALADLLGISVTSAVRWTNLAGAPTDAYAAEVARRRT